MAQVLDPQSFRWLMEGLRIEQKTAIRKGKPRIYSDKNVPKIAYISVL